MRVDWDPRKNFINKLKHGLSFELAQHVFEDEHLLNWPDTRENYYEERFFNLGMVENSLLIMAVHTYRSDINGEEIIRIISARKAKKKEYKKYFNAIAGIA